MKVVAQAVIDLGLPGLLLPQLVHRRVRQIPPAVQLAVVGSWLSLGAESAGLLSPRHHRPSGRRPSDALQGSLATKNRQACQGVMSWTVENGLQGT